MQKLFQEKYQKTTLSTDVQFATRHQIAACKKNVDALRLQQYQHIFAIKKAFNLDFILVLVYNFFVWRVAKICAHNKI